MSESFGRIERRGILSDDLLELLSRFATPTRSLEDVTSDIPETQ